MLIRWTDLDESDVEVYNLSAEQQRYLSETDRGVIGPTIVDRLTTIRTNE